MAERRGRGEDAVYYDHMGTPCRDARYHRTCKGRWRGEINLGKDGSGKRLRRKVSGKTKTEVYAKLDELRGELARNGTGAPRAQIPAKGSLTVQIGGKGGVPSGAGGAAVYIAPRTQALPDSSRPIPRAERRRTCRC